MLIMVVYGNGMLGCEFDIVPAIAPDISRKLVLYVNGDNGMMFMPLNCI